MAEWTEAQLPDLAGKVRKRYGYNVSGPAARCQGAC